jgi:hypothetical protein
MDRFLRIDQTSRTITIPMQRGCVTLTALDGVRLTLWKAGCWPKRTARCETIQSDCGAQTTVAYDEVWPDRWRHTASALTPEGAVVFVIDERFLAAPDGRYTAQLETPCGCVNFQIQKGLPVRLVQPTAPIGGACTTAEAC